MFLIKIHEVKESNVWDVAITQTDCDNATLNLEFTSREEAEEFASKAKDLFAPSKQFEMAG